MTNWLDVDDRYAITLDEGRVVARSSVGKSAGRQLKSLPKSLTGHPDVERLRRYADWLERHSAECLAQVNAWMLSSLPIPATVLAQVWRDDAWRDALRDMVVTGTETNHGGFLRGADTDGLQVVTLDGETVRITDPSALIPHPVLLADLDDLREFGADLAVVQKTEQIYRATWAKPATLNPQHRQVSQFAGGKYQSSSALASRASALGYKISGGYVLCPVRDGATTVQASVWIGESYNYWEEGCTGDLSWRDEEGRALTVNEVGPVAWSEGMRMAAALYAGRMVEEGKNA